MLQTFDPRTSFRIRRHGLFVALCVLLLPCSGRSAFALASDNEPAPSVVATAAALDAAISALSGPSPDYRAILRRAIGSVPAGGPGFVTTGITLFLERAPQAGEDFKCSTGFVAYRATKELVRLENELLGLPSEPVEPEVCYAEPFALDSTHPSEMLEIYGYDLDKVDVEMFLVNSSDFHDVTHAMIRRTHYHVTLRLGSGGVELAPTTQTLGLAWGHLIRYSIPVIQPSTRLCRSWVEEIEAGTTMDFAPRRLATWNNPATPRPTVWALAALGFESNVVDALVCMSAAAADRTGSTFSGCGVSYMRTTESERVVEGILGESQSQIRRESTKQGREMASRPRRGPVALWTFSGLTGVSGSAAEPHVLVRLGTIRIVSSEKDGCVSALAYSEARRTGALSPATVERLDPELRNVPREILGLRSRFAPAPAR